VSEREKLGPGPAQVSEDRVVGLRPRAAALLESRPRSPPSGRTSRPTGRRPGTQRKRRMRGYRDFPPARCQPGGCGGVAIALCRQASRHEAQVSVREGHGYYHFGLEAVGLRAPIRQKIALSIFKENLGDPAAAFGNESVPEVTARISTCTGYEWRWPIRRRFGLHILLARARPCGMIQEISQSAARPRVWPSASPEVSFEHNRAPKWTSG
jgi:hypothetical protein